MSGSGSNPFLDLLRALAPASLPEPVAMLAAAVLAAASAGVFLVVLAWIGRRLEQRLAVPAASAFRASRTAAVVARACLWGALAAYPLSPHVFFTQLGAGVLVTFALTAVALVALASGSELERVLPAVLAIGFALLVPVAAGGTLDWIEASRRQSGGCGMAWVALRNPFALLSLGVYCFAALAATRSLPGEHGVRAIAMFLLSALAATLFLGGFESPLTWALRRSFGEDPGFLDHVIVGGRAHTKIALGGLVFQAACALTLAGKAWLGVAALLWLERAPRWRRASVRFAPRQVWGALACLLGALVFEWARLLASGKLGA